MADGFDEVYVDTRRQLRGVAESLIAGPLTVDIGAEVDVAARSRPRHRRLATWPDLRRCTGGPQ